MTVGLESFQKHLTIEEYLDIEERSFEKHEYHNGKLFTMAGGTPYHSIIAMNIMAAIKAAMRANELSNSVFNSDAKVWLPVFNHYVYADGGVLAQPAAFYPDKKGGVCNPVLLVEVLSFGSTEAYDRGQKFDKYKTLESFREYVLVSQQTPLVEVFYRNETDSNWWQINACSDLESSVTFQSLGLEVRLADIYENIEFEEDIEMPGEA